MGNLIACGWYTPDYAPWLDPLLASLERFGVEHDFVEVNKVSGGWERNTMRKPTMILDAMRRHRGRAIVFLDVDCIVAGPLSDLENIRGDVAARFRCKYMRDGTPRLTARSGTLVVRPTPKAEEFVDRWVDISNAAPRGSVDQRTLPMAIARTPGLSVETLDGSYCAVPSDGIPNPVILHDSASRNVRKISKWGRYLQHCVAKATISDDERHGDAQQH